MNYRFLVVKLAHPYNYDNVVESFDMFNLSNKEDVCIYIAETNKKHDHLITLTPISVYAVMFPIDSIEENELRKTVNKRIFDVGTDFMKAQGFADYVKLFIKYLYMCQTNPNKYYIEYGRNTIKCKKNKYFLNGSQYLSSELINMIFVRGAWEYEDLKLKQYNILKRLFFK